MLVIAGYGIRRSVESAAQMEMAEGLKATLNSNVEALKIWLESEQSRAVEASLEPEVRRIASGLARLADTSAGDPAALAQSPLQEELKAALRLIVSNDRYEGYVLLSKDRLILASNRPELIGQVRMTNYDLVARTLAKGAIVTPPIASALLMADADGVQRAGLPTMFAFARQMDLTGDPVGVLGLRIRPDKDFVRILQIARPGATGETYAFDKNGLMLSESRFTDQLKRIGLVVDQPGAKSQLTIHIRDPGVDLTKGARAAKSRSQQPLTVMAADAVQGHTGMNVTGYRDYRGVPVVGAWTWLDEYGIGVTTEKDVAEAYRSLYILRRAFWSLFGLLAASAGLIFAFSLAMSRLQKVAQKAALAARELGQYQLEEKLGEGGMGVVYRGHHRMLRRPTAIKLLHPDKTTDEAIARFEREVQLTCQLNHPNTIAIYDYGRTPEGLFFYAMEYLDGINLDALVHRLGPQPAGRVIHILRQVCGSLAEAHEIGLVHRDIKPANVILSRRGGEADVAKVLDFGLVKAVDSKKQASLTSAGAVIGTPLYMSPESIESPDQIDGRSDLYAVAALGYFLLTGHPPFEGTTVVEICMHHARSTPRPPGERLGLPIAADLEGVLLKGLAKKPGDRFANAREFERALAACSDAARWTREAADAWWQEQSAMAAKTASPGEKTSSIHELPTLITTSPLTKT
jgi:serine/threonine protein kinase